MRLMIFGAGYSGKAIGKLPQAKASANAPSGIRNIPAVTAKASPTQGITVGGASAATIVHPRLQDSAMHSG